MTQTALQPNPVQLLGDPPRVGNKAPEFTLTSGNLGEVTSETFADKKVVYSIFPSIDTGAYAASVHRFSEDAAGLDNIIVVNVFRDLPFAPGRFYTAEGLDNVEVASDFRHGFDEAFDVIQQGDPSAGLLARAVIIADEESKVIYNQLVDEITTKPDYDSALAAPK